MPQRAPGRRSVRRWRAVWGCSALLSLAWSRPVTGHLADPPVLVVADTVTGALAQYHVAVGAFASAFGLLAWDGGLLTDELRAPLNGLTVRDLPLNAAPPGWWNYTSRDIGRRLNLKDVRRIPERVNPQDTTPDDDGDNGFGSYVEHIREAQLDEGYLRMQGTRAYISVALRQLAIGSSIPMDPAMIAVDRGELYALEGYAEVLLADLFCSGVPLNTFAEVPVARMGLIRPYRTEKDYYLQILGNRNQALVYKSALTRQGQIVYHPSATTTQVYQAALAKFDTALSLVGDSARILNLARVGKGRAWSDLGQYDSAAAAVAQVPQGFVYALRTRVNLDPDGDEEDGTVADREGRNGLPFISSGDPRTTTKWIEADKLVTKVRVPARFSDLDSDGIGPVTFTLASWEEAVLIHAEAALQRNAADGTWLHLLNQLRATAPIPGTTQPDPTQLPPLTDPGTDRARIALLFAERAKWLFLTGHRQGDLRRLVREYHWPQAQVYPTGPYIVPEGFVGQVGTYGTDVNLPIPPEELANPLFHGCLDRGP
ncbi:MAG TPA: hypothetical protein VNU46_08425 [Gemmatimonadaceae bacterium]|nr:hypothetical protein [Gemmatimonadaceae bacterium]